MQIAVPKSHLAASLSITPELIGLPLSNARVDQRAIALADAIVIALHTGQRQGDVLALEEPRIDGGRARFRQGKTGAQVAVPFTEQLDARLTAIKVRRARLSGVIDLKLALSSDLRARRVAKGMTQAELAKRLGSSQSRVAKMEAADSTVTVDLLVRAHLALGATHRDLARAIGKASKAA